MSRLAALLATLASSVSLGAQSPGAAQDHPVQYPAADIAVGQRIYSSLCIGCHGPAGASIAAVDLRRGPLRRAATDVALRALVTSGIPLSGMPSFTLEPAELDGIVAFIRSGFDAGANVAVAVGDAARGRALFETKGSCLACHRVEGRGAFKAPELTEIGRLRSPLALQRSLLDPTGSMMPINRPVRAVTRGGATITGHRLNEDLFTVQVTTDEGRLVTLVKSELREWSVSTMSPMPSYKDTLTASELSDVVGYLVSLKGARP
jgi:putative heme-binding domain-containing protein